MFARKYSEKKSLNGNTKKQKRGWTLKVLFCCLLTVLLVGLVGSVGFADTFVWDGSTDRDWTEPTNWDLDASYPDSDDIAVFIEVFGSGYPDSNFPALVDEIRVRGAADDATVTLPTITCNTLTIDTADSHSSTLIMSGDLTVNTTLTVQASDSGAFNAQLDLAKYNLSGSPAVNIQCSSDDTSAGTASIIATNPDGDESYNVDVIAISATTTTGPGDNASWNLGGASLTATSITLTAGDETTSGKGNASFNDGGGTVTLTGAITLMDVTDVANNGAVTFISSGTIYYPYSAGAPDLDLTNVSTAAGTGWQHSGTIVFNGTGAQTIAANGSNEYQDFGSVIIDNTHASGVQFANALSLDGSLTISAGCVFDDNDADVTVGDALSVGAGSTLSITAASQTLTVTGATTVSGTITTGTDATDPSLDFDGNVTLGGTGSITAAATGGGSVTFGGDLDNSAGGNINMTAGTVTFDGTSAMEYTVGSGTNTLNTVSVNGAALTISGSEGTLNIDGTLTPAANTGDITGGSNVTVTFSASVNLSNNADLVLSGPVNFDSDATITLGTGTVSFGNPSNAITIDDPNGTSAVKLTLAGTGLITFAGDLNIGYGNDTTTDELECAVGTVTIKIGAGRTVTNEGILDLRGAANNKILIASSEVNSQWYLDNSDANAKLGDPDGDGDLAHVAVRDCALTTNGSETKGTAVVNATGNSGWVDASGNSLFNSPVASGKRALSTFSDFTNITGDTEGYDPYVSREHSTAIDDVANDLGTKYDINAGTVQGGTINGNLVWDSNDTPSPAQAPKGKYYLYLEANDEIGGDGAYVIISDYAINISDIIVLEPLSPASTEDEVFTSLLIQWDDNDDDATIDIRYSTQSDLTMLNYADNSTRITTVSASLTGTGDQYRWDCSSVASDSGTTYYIYLIAINESGGSMDVSDGMTIRGINFTAPADTGVTANTATVDSDTYDDETENVVSDHKYYHLGWTDYEDDITNDNLDVYVSQNLYTSVTALRAAYSATPKAAFRIVADKNPGTNAAGAEGNLAANVSVAKWDLTTGYGDDGTDPFPEGAYYVYIVADDYYGQDTDGDGENDTYDELIKAPGQVTVVHDPFFYTANGNVTAPITGTATGGAGDGTTVTGASSLNSTTDDYYKNAVITITSGDYSGESRIISGYTAGTHTIEVSPAFSGQIVSGVTYRIYNILSVSATADSGATVDTPGTAAVYWKGNDVDDSATVVLYVAASTIDYTSASEIEANATSFATGQSEYNSTGYTSWDYYSSGNLVSAGEYYVWAVMTDTSGDKAYKKSAGTITISHSPKIRIDNPPASSITTTTNKYYTVEWTDVDYDQTGQVDVYFSSTSKLGGNIGGELTSVADRSAVLNYTKVTTSAPVSEDLESENDRYLIDLAGTSSDQLADGEKYYIYVVMDVDGDEVPDAGYQSGPIVVEHQSSISITAPALDDMTTTDYTINWLQKWDNQGTLTMDVDLYYDTTNTKTLGNLDDSIGSTNAPAGIIELNVNMDGDDEDAGDRYDESRSTVWDDIVITSTTGPTAADGTTLTHAAVLTETTNDYYVGRRLVITKGKAAGMVGRITDYDASSNKITYTKISGDTIAAATDVEAYKIYIPDGTYYVYAVLDVNGDSKYNVTSSVTSQTTEDSGAGTSLVADPATSGLSTIDDFYNGCRITITDTSSDAYGQSRIISDYEGDGVGGIAGTITVTKAFLDGNGTEMTDIGSGVSFRIDPLETYSVSVGTVTISNYTIEADTPEDFHDVNDVFNVDMKIDTNGQAITAANLYIDFNTTTLELDNPSAPFCTVVSDTTLSAGATTGTTLVGGGGSVTLSSVDDYYNGSKIIITSGAYKGESRTITDYDGSSKTFTVNPAFSGKIAASVTYEINTPLSATNNQIGGSSGWTVHVVENSGNNDDGKLGLVVLSTVANAKAFASSGSFVSVAFKAKAAGNTELEFAFDSANSRMTQMIDDDGEEHIPHNAGSAHIRSSTTGTSSISGKVLLQGYAGSTYPQMTFELRKPGVYGHYSGYTCPEDADADTIGIQLTPGTDGSFTLTQVPAGEYFLTAKAPHYLRGQNDDSVPLEVRPGQNIENVLIHGYDDANSDGDYADSGEEFDYLLAGDTATTTYPEDNVITAYDVTNLVNNFGLTSTEALTAADINGDGAVDITDFSLLAANWGRNAIKPTSGPAGVGNSAPADVAQGPILAIVGLPDTIYLGDELDVKVVASSAYEATGFGFELGFDAGRVTLNNVQEGDFFAGETLFVAKELSVGNAAQSRSAKKLSVGSASFDGSAKGGTLVSFKLVPTAAGELTLTLNDGKLITKNGSVIDVARKFVVKVIAKPTKSVLLQNFPNPFNPETWIPFALREDANVEIRIYNLSGQLVRTLNLGQKPAAHYLTKDKAAYWNGRNDSGEEVSSGVYFYHIVATEGRRYEFNAVKKMVILK